MNKNIKRVRYTTRQRTNKIGESPGSINIPEDAVKPHILIFSYNSKELVKSEGKNIKIILDQIKKCTDHTHWIQIKGLGDEQLLEDIGSFLNINSLVLEDIANTHQRPKLDEYPDYLFVVRLH